MNRRKQISQHVQIIQTVCNWYLLTTYNLYITAVRLYFSSLIITSKESIDFNKIHSSFYIFQIFKKNLTTVIKLMKFILFCKKKCLKNFLNFILLGLWQFFHNQRNFVKFVENIFWRIVIQIAIKFFFQATVNNWYAIKVI